MFYLLKMCIQLGMYKVRHRGMGMLTRLGKRRKKFNQLYLSTRLLHTGSATKKPMCICSRQGICGTLEETSLNR